MFDPIKKLQKGQSQALAVFQKAKEKQEQVLGGIASETIKVKDRIAKQQAKEQELLAMETSANKFLAKIDNFLGVDAPEVNDKE